MNMREESIALLQVGGFFVDDADGRGKKLNGVGKHIGDCGEGGEKLSSGFQREEGAWRIGEQDENGGLACVAGQAGGLRGEQGVEVAGDYQYGSGQV